MSTAINLSKKLIFLVLIVSVITIGITGFFSFNYADQVLLERTGEQLLGESEIRGETIRLLLESRIEQSGILAGDPMIRLLVAEMNGLGGEQLAEAQASNRRDYLIQIQAFQELIGFSIGLEDAKIIGRDGTVFFSLAGRGGEDYGNNDLFLRGLGEPFVAFEPAEGGKRMLVVMPIYAEDGKRGDDPIGVIITRMRTATIDGILTNRSGLGESGEVYIVNDRHLMLSESRFADGVIFAQEVGTVPVQRCFGDGGQFRGFYDGYRGTPVYGSSYCADSMGLVLIAEIDQAEVKRPIGVLGDRILLTGIAMTAAMVVAAFFISKSLSRPLIKLKSAANKIASGDFAVRTNISTADEIGELSGAFDSMARRLQESVIEIKEKEDVIKQQEEILLKFSQHEQNDCVCVIDMKDSTKISARLSDNDVSKMYEIFLNFMARIVRKNGGEVVKNIGDALMFRFPNMDENNPAAMKNILECCLEMIESHDLLAAELAAEDIGALDYKISATYGPVKVAESTTSNISDIFGPTVNRCFKINSLCPKNSIVVGINLYTIFKDFAEYEFSELSSNEVQEKYGYSIFEVRRA